MNKNKKLYGVVAIAAFVFIFYIVYMYFFRDPNASAFLSTKTDTRRPPDVEAWLKVMRVHAILACIAMVLGIVNFSKRFLRKFRTWHRINGYLYLLCVVVVAVTSGYMAPYSTGGRITSIAFNLLSMVWLAMTIAAIVKIKKKQIVRHQKWAVRSFAFCFTNMFIHLYTSILHYGFGVPYVDSYTVGIFATIATLFLLAEYVIRNILELHTHNASTGINSNVH
ncbi:Uncharacterized membrane protein [Paenibacillus uliginis N3/975]|uniref:Uncharacterized membrane protein n=1 Tax=Paenibacillus uliginis N3/975 TaxID=1313296 RepID=A0A1X7H7H1_9BACL|nr:DUF2306 domain-containing protein [Paenibacillus uliginis]SMF81022.1 Uncharacterized membrane protein [Paenibacillus uliginis N3/975]